MKIFNISNPKALFERIESCHGNIYAVEDGGKTQDMKALAEYLKRTDMLRFMGAIDQMEIVAERPEDTVVLMRFVSEMPVGA